LSFRVGILAVPLSEAGAVMRWCTVQISGSLAFSSQSHQCCFLVNSNVLAYLLAASLCLLCTAWSGLSFCLCNCLPSLFTCFLSCVSSFVHHLFDLGVILVIGTCLWMVSWIAVVRSSQLLSSCLCVLICSASFLLLSFPSSALLNSSQSTSLKLCLGSSMWG
jgi:hypothetical protein